MDAADLTPTATKPRALPANLLSTIVKVAWLAVLLGVGMEVVLLLADAFLNRSRETDAIVADTLGKISWTTLACTGLALGARAAELRPGATGFVGFLCAPVSFVIARVIHASAANILETNGPALAVPLVAALGVIKAVEYGGFGAMVAWISTRTRASVGTYAFTGATFGLIFGALLGVATARLAQTPPAFPDLLVLTVNETFFALGCAITLYVCGVLGPALQQE